MSSCTSSRVPRTSLVVLVRRREQPVQRGIVRTGAEQRAQLYGEVDEQRPLLAGEPQEDAAVCLSLEH
jgi:hypothetical protein